MCLRECPHLHTTVRFRDDCVQAAMWILEKLFNGGVTNVCPSALDLFKPLEV